MENRAIAEEHGMSAAGEGVNTNQNKEVENFGIEGNASEKHEELREAERLLFFNDATIAIAATLLILPLMEAVTDEEADSDEETVTAVDYFSTHGSKLLGFAFNFLKVFDFWMLHAFAMAHVEHLTPLLSAINHILIVAIVFLPVTISLMWTPDNLSNITFYFVVILVVHVLMVLVKLIAFRDPRVWSKYGAPTLYDFSKSLVKIVTTVIAILVAIYAPEPWTLIAFAIDVLLPGIAMATIQLIFRMEKNKIDVLADRYGTASAIKTTVHSIVKKFKGCCTTDDLQAQNVNGEGKDYIDMLSERLIIFTDGTTAISMTLLILPLMEHANENMSTVGGYFKENGALFFQFLLTYLVVLMAWSRHDDKFRFIEEKVPATFLFCSAIWILTLAFVPVATVLLVINEDDSDTLKFAVYIILLTINQSVEVAMSLVVFSEWKEYPWQKVFRSIIILVLFAAGIPVALYVQVQSVASNVALVVLPAYPIAALLAKWLPGIESLIHKIA